jgi:hypothetical protein
MNIIDSEQNTSIRKSIKKVFSGMTFSNRQEIITNITAIADDERLVDLVDEFYKRTISKHELEEIFNHSKYMFDRLTIAHLIDLVDGWKLLSSSKQSDTKQQIKSLLQKLTSSAKHYSKENLLALVEEIINPFRRWYIINASYKVNLRSLISYEKHEDENIYVNVL